MKIRFLAIVLFLSCSSSVAYGQQAKLEGYVFDDKARPVAAVTIVAPGGQAAETDSRGHFVIAFPKAIQPGQATRIEVLKPNWVIYEPVLGNSVTQRSDRNNVPLMVFIAPKGSPLALSSKRLSQVMAKWADERAKLHSQVDQLSSPRDEYAFLREYSQKYGFTLDQFINAANQWAQSKESDDKEERALKEYFLKNYNIAARLAHESALVADRELQQVNQQKTEDARKLIRIFKLEGSAYYAQYKFREALVAYNEIDRRFSSGKLSKENLIDEWAEIKNLLGLTKQELGIRVEGQESQSFLAESVENYHQALTVYTHEQLPQQWAGTQNNLGVALRSLGERLEGAEGIKLLQLSVETYQKALEVRTREQLPQQWAETQNNLGNVLRVRGERLEGAEGAKALMEAVEAYRAALQVYTREETPQQWAETQNNLGNVLRVRGERLEGAQGAKALMQAVEAFRKALEVRTREQLPQQWAATQNNLGAVLGSQGERMAGPDGVKLLKQAVEAYRAALQVYTREELPQQWAATLNNLGTVLSEQGERQEGVEGMKLLEEAVEVYRAALRVNSRETLPLDWAATQNNLGTTLRSLGERQGVEGVRLLKEAEIAFRETLRVRSRELLPFLWAETQNNLANVLWSQGERMKGAEGIKLLQQSIEAYREALEVRTREQLPQQWAMTQNNLGNVLSSEGERMEGSGGIKLLQQSAEAYRKALEVNTREQLPEQWAGTQNNLGDVLRSQGERMDGAEGVKLLQQSVEAYQKALEVYTREQLPQKWVITQNSLAKAYFLLRNWPGAAESYGNVLMLYPNYEEAYIRLSAIYHEILFKFEEAFALNQQWLARHPNDVSAQANFAEKYFTMGRFAECAQRISALLIKPDVPISTKAALRAVEIADLLALGQTKQVLAKMDALIAEISNQPSEFKVDWSFEGTKHFIGQNEKLLRYRTWLKQLFAALAQPTRDQIIKGLNETKAAFK